MEYTKKSLNFQGTLDFHILQRSLKEFKALFRNTALKTIKGSSSSLVVWKDNVKSWWQECIWATVTWVLAYTQAIYFFSLEHYTFQ